MNKQLTKDQAQKKSEVQHQRQGDPEDLGFFPDHRRMESEILEIATCSHGENIIKFLVDMNEDLTKGDRE